MPKYIEVAGIQIEVRDDAACEQADVVLCAIATPETEAQFPDNRRGVCSVCGVAIVYRPYAPMRPPKMCVPCFVKQADIGKPDR